MIWVIVWAAVVALTAFQAVTSMVFDYDRALRTALAALLLVTLLWLRDAVRDYRSTQDDGLMPWERRRYARRYAHTAARKPTAAEAAEVSRRLDERWKS